MLLVSTMEAIKEASIKPRLKDFLMTIQHISQVVLNKGQNLVLLTKVDKAQIQ